jgi:hypothetical protein
LRAGVKVGVGKAVLVGEGDPTDVRVGVIEGWAVGVGVRVGVDETCAVGPGVRVGVGREVGVGVGVSAAPKPETVRFNSTSVSLCQVPVWSASTPTNSN